MYETNLAIRNTSCLDDRLNPENTLDEIDPVYLDWSIADSFHFLYLRLLNVPEDHPEKYHMGLIRGSSFVKSHAELLGQIEEEFTSFGDITYEVVGGGMITIDREKKTLRVGGTNQSYGDFDRDAVLKVTNYHGVQPLLERYIEDDEELHDFSVSLEY